MTEGKWQETQPLNLGPTDRAQFLESQPRSGRPSGGQPSRGLGSVLHGRGSKSTQAPAGPRPPTEDKEIQASRPLSPWKHSLSHSPRGPSVPDFPLQGVHPPQGTTCLRPQGWSPHLHGGAVPGQEDPASLVSNDSHLLSSFYTCVILFAPYDER